MLTMKLETSEGSSWQHPLFDPNSLYRLSTADSVWSDGGQQSVRDFFAGLARTSLQEEWLAPPPDSPQPWGLVGVADETVHRLLKERQDIEDPVEETAVAEPACAGAMPSTPALLVEILDGQVSLPQPQRGRQLFTGAGTLRGEWPEGWESTFWARIPLAAWHSKPLVASRRCLLLLLTYDLVKRLARALGQPLSEKEKDALNVIGAALRRDVLTLEQSTQEGRRRASRLSGILALAPGVEATTDAEGRFQAKVDLQRPCPILNGWTWAVCCVGGKVEET